MRATLPPEQWENWVLQGYPEEVVGLLLSDGNLLPMVNRSRRPRRAWEVDASELLPALQQLRASGLDMVSWVHSHPHGLPQPSRRDPEGLVLATDGKRVWWT